MARDPEKACLGHGHTNGLVGQIDRALLNHRIDVETPGIVINQYIQRKLEFLNHALKQSPCTSRGHATARNQCTLVPLPEFVFIQTRPDRVLLHEENELATRVTKL